MNILLDILLPAYFFFLVLVIYIVLTHRKEEYWNEATKNECEVVAYGTYEDFLKQMSKYKWVRDGRFPESFLIKDFEESLKTEVHANIFKFNSIGMIFIKEDYKKVQRWLKDHEYKENKLISFIVYLYHLEY